MIFKYFLHPTHDESRQKSAPAAYWRRALRLSSLACCLLYLSYPPPNVRLSVGLRSYLKIYFFYVLAAGQVFVGITAFIIKVKTKTGGVNAEFYLAGRAIAVFSND